MGADLTAILVLNQLMVNPRNFHRQGLEPLEKFNELEIFRGFRPELRQFNWQNRSGEKINYFKIYSDMKYKIYINVQLDHGKIF